MELVGEDHVSRWRNDIKVTREALCQALGASVALRNAIWSTSNGLATTRARIGRSTTISPPARLQTAGGSNTADELKLGWPMWGL